MNERRVSYNSFTNLRWVVIWFLFLLATGTEISYAALLCLFLFPVLAIVDLIFEVYAERKRR